MQDAEITKSLCTCNSKDWFTCKSENKVTWSKKDTEIGSIALSYCLKLCVKEYGCKILKGHGQISGLVLIHVYFFHS